MCGIGGILSKTTQQIPASALDAMSQALAHRGPDDSGLYLSTNGYIGLVHRRLSIIDLSPSARQPMTDATGRLQIVFNGEIYNYRQLGEELLKKGYQFRTSSDTEVVLSLYLAEGEKFLEKLRGMFAFALWDKKNQTLLLARDRMGIKPLYYAETPEFFLFASEVRTLLSTGLVKRELCPEAVSAYLSLGSIPSPLTIIRGIKSLEPAGFAVVKTGKMVHRQYWSIHFAPDFSSNDQLSLLSTQLKDAVRSHLVSDVPVGLFLSGGIDSTAIASIMRSITSGPIQTFSIAFPNTPLDESKFARLAAQIHATSHIEKAITAQEVKEAFPHILASMDQPTIDGVNTYFVSQLARQSGVKVVLSGLGGDELFAGYPSYRIIPRLTRLYELSKKIPLGKTAARILFKSILSSSRSKSMDYFFQEGGSVEAGFFAVRRLFLDAEKENLLTRQWRDQSNSMFHPVSYLQRLVQNGQPLHPLEAIEIMEMRAYMHNQLLRDSDVMAMAHGVEVRVPFLDHQLVEAVHRIPPGKKTGKRPKELLLSVLENRIPSQIHRRPKMGFTFPFGTWMKHELRPLLDPFFRTRPPVNGRALWNWIEVEHLWDEFLNGRLHWTRPWSVFVLNSWIEANGIQA